MKIVLALLLLVGLTASMPLDSFDKKFENMNIDEVLNNERLYLNFYNCFAQKGKCGKDALYLKDVLPDALQTKCAKCTDEQKRRIDQIFTFMVEKRPKDFATLEAMADPEYKYREIWADEAKAKGIAFPPKITTIE